MSDDVVPLCLEQPRSDDDVRAWSVVGTDESGNAGDGVFVTVAVRSSRSAGTQLVRLLVENDLQPFCHKSSSLVRYTDADKPDRRRRVRALLDDLSHTSLSWAAVVAAPPLDDPAAAAMYAVAAKKSITGGLKSGTETNRPVVVLRDGHIVRGDNQQALPRQLRSHCDDSFERNICPVHLSSLNHAERTYPQVAAADYIAGYLREVTEQHESVATAVRRLDCSRLVQYDDSWNDPARRPTPVAELETVTPIRERRVESRVLAWISGRAVAVGCDPVSRSQYGDIYGRIDDRVVRDYLRDLD